MNKTKRIFASIIDFYIICFLSSCVVGVCTLGELNITPFSLTMYLLSYLLFLVFRDLAFKNASIGKRIFKLKVIKTDGTDLMIGDIIKRNIPIVILVPVEVFLIAVDNRRLGDIWAKTTVV